MAVDFDKFADWAKNRFGEENIIVNKGKGEVRLNSIFPPFTDDEGHHLWCSPGGGKKKRKLGTYHCFKSDKKGSLVKLIQIVDSCDRDDALAILKGHSSIRDLERRLEEMLAEPAPVVLPEPKPEFVLPPGCLLISDLGSNNWWGRKASEYLAGRKIPEDGLYICTEDRYRGRIIIPYYDREGKLIYFNGRHLGQSKCKYLGPPKEVGVGKEDVVFMAGGVWPKPGSTVHLCEGEFNAISLKLCDFNAGACGGKNMSEKQALMLADYRIVLCLDRDKAGKLGTLKMSSIVSMMETCKGISEKFLYVIPPPGFNDWNEMLVKKGEAFVHHYINKYQKVLDCFGPMGTTGDFFGLSDIWR